MNLTDNLLIRSLSPAAAELLLARAQEVFLPVRSGVSEPEEQPKYAYFPVSGFVSVVIELAGGGSAEVALIGREGMVGGLEMLGPAFTPARSFVQLEAEAYRLPFTEMRRIFTESEEIRDRVLEMVQSQSLTMSQLAACNKLHDAETRLARWLLMVRDRADSDTFPLTQEFIAEMLGTQRTTVVMVAGALQRRGLISYSRGKLTIRSREDLEAAACDCYQVARRLFVGLYSSQSTNPDRAVGTADKSDEPRFASDANS